MSWQVGAGLDDRVAVVSGGAGGIGAEVCQALARAGARVCVVDLQEESIERVVAALPGPGRHRGIAADLMDVSGHRALVRRIASEMGELHSLTHLAAVLRRRADVDDITEQDWDVQVDLNLKAAFFLDVAFARVLRDQGTGGSIVNFSSQGWQTGGLGGSVVYNAAKGGIVTMSRGLARTYAPERIRVNAVAPGFVNTPMMFDGSISREAIDALVAQVPMKRLAEPGEIAQACVFLASDHASYITGTTINISGGFLMY